MFFILSKIIWAIISPLTLIVILLVIGAILTRLTKTKNLGKIIIKLTLLLLISLSLLPIGYNLQVLLEKQHPQTELLKEDQYAGVIILGGCISTELSKQYDTTIINGSCERLLEGINLHKNFPNLPIIYTGGSGNIFNQKHKEADIAQTFFQSLVIDTTNFIFERNARNTYENMALSKKYIDKNNKKPWLLVTSASHMPRATRIFCQGEWNIIPHPVDFNTNGRYKLKFFTPSYNFHMLDRAAKEIIGIIAYGVSGKLSLNACQ